MLFPQEIIHAIMDCAHWADRLVRADLIDGFVVSENDYTSNFTGSLRREINARHFPGLSAKVQVLNPSAEREIGADACIILQNKTEFKASVFEAKWPRLSTHEDTWDSRQKSSGESHFHSQLLRQCAQSHYAAIWEMFYCEFPFGKQPKDFPPEGSACVWHSDAYSATLARPDPKAPWTDQELKFLLEGRTLTIADVIESICNCSQGSPLPNDNYRAAFGDVAPPHSALVISYSRPGEQ
ncbi:hypothetical protein [Thiobaca trueperi]|uniref:Uncharacterized protein n=1 Tax=Thiobaca trueperi TaxID=127458 RepID=A0A4R3N537_9GAMM|nr:hypothetical protein [Thiobaca trueperi]TCT22213.1 hypothetical protein EDC35_103312 [Thiobaca trueperi]